MSRYYADRTGRRHPVCFDGDEVAALDYIRENLASDDPADHIRAAAAQRELDAICDYIDGLPDSDMELRRLIG